VQKSSGRAYDRGDWCNVVRSPPVILDSDAAIAPPTNSQPSAPCPASDTGHTWHFSVFAPVSPIRDQFRRSGWLLLRAVWSGRTRGDPGLMSHDLEALLFRRGSYIVWVWAATDKFLAQTASRRQMQGRAKLMGMPIKPTVRRPPQRDLSPSPGFGAAARRLPDFGDAADEPGLTTSVLARKRTLRLRPAAGVQRR
jgi:hypothetical protein